MKRRDDLELTRLAGSDEPAGAFLRGLQRLAEPVPPDVAERHIAAILEAAGSADPVPVRRPRRALRLATALAAALVALGTVATGLSYAGVVTLPSPARTALSWIGIDLPDRQETTGPTVVETPPDDPPVAEPTQTPTDTPRGDGRGRDHDLPDEADDRAGLRGDNADDRSDLKGDNADRDPSEDKGDNADDRSDGDNASENADTGDVAP